MDDDSLVSQATAATDSTPAQSPSGQSVSHRQSGSTSNLSDNDDVRDAPHHDADSDDVNDDDVGDEVDEVSSQLEELGISQTTRSSTL